MVDFGFLLLLNLMFVHFFLNCFIKLKINIFDTETKIHSMCLVIFTDGIVRGTWCKICPKNFKSKKVSILLEIDFKKMRLEKGALI